MGAMGAVEAICRVGGVEEVLSLVFTSFIFVISWAFFRGSFSRRNVSVMDSLLSLEGSEVVTLLGTLLGTSFVLSFLFFFVVSLCEPTYVKLAFENGPQQQGLKSHPVCFVNRSNVTQFLETLMTLQRSGVYNLVNGPHGCGKSTTLKEAVAVSVSPPGTVYVEVRSDGSFPMALAETLSIDFACPSGSFYDYITAITSYTFRRKCPTDMKEQLVSILNVLRSVVEDMEQHPTLVIDNLSALFSHPYEASGKDLIQILQGFAKSMADTELLSIVLAGSEGKLVDFLYKSSSASRLHVYNFATDISFEEAVTYLTCLSHPLHFLHP